MKTRPSHGQGNGKREAVAARWPIERCAEFLAYQVAALVSDQAGAPTPHADLHGAECRPSTREGGSESGLIRLMVE